MTKNKETLKILKYGNPLLRKKVSDIVDFSGLNSLINKMFLTMREENGIGLAANQIGESINLLIVDSSTIDEEEKKSYVFINSKIIETEGSIIMEEGCLSVPEIRAEIQRPESITIQFQDIDQNIKVEKFSSIISRVIQHELAHLDGKYFIDYLTPSKRILIQKRLLEISKSGKPSTGIII